MNMIPYHHMASLPNRPRTRSVPRPTSSRIGLRAAAVRPQSPARWRLASIRETIVTSDVRRNLVCQVYRGNVSNGLRKQDIH